MNDANLIGMPMSDEDYFRLQIRAARGDPEAIEIVEKIRERISICAESARAAWGYTKPQIPLTMLTSLADLVPPEDLGEWLEMHVGLADLE